MSGIEADPVDMDLAVGDGPQAIMKPTIEVVFDTVRSTEGEPTDADARGRIARGIAALQKAGGGVGRVPAEAEKGAAKASEAVPEPKNGSSGLIVDSEKLEEGVGEVKEVSGEAKGAENAAEKATEAKIEPLSVDLEAVRADLAAAQARIATLTAGDLPDEDRVAWIEKPTDWIRGEMARRMGVAVDDQAVKDALAYVQWALTVDLLGGELPGDLKERNDTEQKGRREALTRTARSAQEAAGTRASGRAAVHRLVTDQLTASSDKFPHAAAGAELNLGGVSAAEAAIYLWGEAVKRGEVKNTGDDAKDIPEALRLYDKFCKTMLGKARLQNATPPPANTPAASKEAAPGTKGKPPTMSAKDAAAAPAAKKVEQAPAGPETIDASDRAGRYRRVAAVASKHFSGK
jgi:hypothetical protein